jgi:4-carboxymuconolactone decarboxylase
MVTANSTREQVEDVLPLIAIPCGIPAAIEPNQIAAEVFGKDTAAGAAKP